MSTAYPPSAQATKSLRKTIGQLRPRTEGGKA